MNQATYPYDGDEHELISVGGEFTSLAGAGPVTVVNGSVLSVVRAGVGDYDITFRDGYPYGRNPVTHYIDAALLQTKVTAFDPVAATMSVQVYDLNTGVAAEGAGGVQISVGFEGVNTSARFRTNHAP